MTTVNTQQVSNELLATMNGTSSSSTSAQSSTDAATNRFMTLLVTQLKNQDPLNPMDNAQLTSQLAQLSTVTGINQLNTTVDSLLGSLQSSQSYQASSLVGHNVLVDGNALSLKDGAGYFGIDLPVGANNVTVTIKDSSGTPVKSITMGKQDAGTLPLVWDGTTDSGTTAANGKYTFDVSATISNTSVTATGLSYQSVLSVSNTTSGVKLNLSDNSSVSTDSVKEIF